MKPGDVDWDHLFGDLGVRWLHTGGIFAALSESAADTVIEAVTAAKKHGTIVSYDLNYRPSLWQAIGGQAKAQQVNAAIAPHIDVMIGNEEDFTASLGLQIAGLDENLSALPVDTFAAMIHAAASTYPNFKVIATTMRTLHAASSNDWGAIAWSPNHRRRPGHQPATAGDPGPGRRRRLLRLRTDLRAPDRAVATDRSPVLRRPRRAGHDHTRRHHHGHQSRSPQARRRRHRPRQPLSTATPASTADHRGPRVNR
jgi:hypothetical protein